MKNFAYIIVVLFLCFNVPFLLPQDRTKSVHISRTENPPRIDGIINDDCWQGVEPVSGFFQFDPVNGVKASEEFIHLLYCICRSR